MVAFCYHYWILLILCTTNSYGSIFPCSDVNSCAAHTMNCSSGELCLVDCNGAISCKNAIFNCNDATSCHVTCIGYWSCYNMTVNGNQAASLSIMTVLGDIDTHELELIDVSCPDNGLCEIECTSVSETCLDATFRAESSPSLNITCTGTQGNCHNITVYCPINGAAMDCIIRGEHDINNGNIDNIKIYAQNGFAGMTLHLSGTSTSQRSIGRIYCSNNYASSCMIDPNDESQCDTNSMDKTCDDVTMLTTSIPTATTAIPTTTTATPTTDIPSTATSTTSIPTTDIPTTDIPTTDIPTTAIPTTTIPTTAMPTTAIPTTAIPTTDIPTTDIPTTATPTTSIPTTAIPTTSIPTTDIPTTATPTTDTSSTVTLTATPSTATTVTDIIMTTIISTAATPITTDKQQANNFTIIINIDTNTNNVTVYIIETIILDSLNISDNDIIFIQIYDESITALISVALDVPLDSVKIQENIKNEIEEKYGSESDISVTVNKNDNRTDDVEKSNIIPIILSIMGAFICCMVLCFVIAIIHKAKKQTAIDTEMCTIQTKSVEIRNVIMDRDNNNEVIENMNYKMTIEGEGDCIDHKIKYDFHSDNDSEIIDNICDTAGNTKGNDDVAVVDSDSFVVIGDDQSTNR